MLDQMFTVENFRRIYDLENRKGNNIAGRFFPDLDFHTLAVKDKVENLRQLRTAERTMTADIYRQSVSSAKKEIADCKANKSAEVDKELEHVSEKALTTTFKIELTKGIGPQCKPVNLIDSSPETFFVVKQLQVNLNKLYGVKQANRHDLICRVRDTISTKFPYELVRTDISEFYESINRQALFSKLETDQLLSPSSKKYLRQILASYGRLSGSSEGIPRGVGISAYLSELYLRPVDDAIKRLPGLVLYCRYVDDIVAIFARPPAGKPIGSYLTHIKDICAKHSLKLNTSKTKIFKFADPCLVKFEYLGYRILKDEQTYIAPSAAKIRRYKFRLNASFDQYIQDRHLRPQRSFRDLVARIKFLTGNTRLSNSKSSAVTGVYYNNSLANKLDSLTQLDKILKKRINQLTSKRLKKRLKQYRFKDGFEERRFHNFSTRELQMIVEVWKHA